MRINEPSLQPNAADAFAPLFTPDLANSLPSSFSRIERKERIFEGSAPSREKEYSWGGEFYDRDEFYYCSARVGGKKKKGREKREEIREERINSRSRAGFYFRMCFTPKRQTDVNLSLYAI